MARYIVNAKRRETICRNHETTKNDVVSSFEPTWLNHIKSLQNRIFREFFWWLIPSKIWFNPTKSRELMIKSLGQPSASPRPRCLSQVLVSSYLCTPLRCKAGGCSSALQCFLGLGWWNMLKPQLLVAAWCSNTSNCARQSQNGLQKFLPLQFRDLATSPNLWISSVLRSVISWGA